MPWEGMCRKLNSQKTCRINFPFFTVTESAVCLQYLHMFWGLAFLLKHFPVGISAWAISL